MLKTFMQTGPNGQAKTEANRAVHTGYPSRTAEPTKVGGAAEAAHSERNDEGSKLIVGPNIKLKGAEITDCEILVVEGRVEASMNSRDIRIAEGGVFSGKAEIDVAEVRGTFEGELTARKRLVIYATGRVNGTIRYGAMMIEEGGTISGNVAMHTAGPSLVKVTEPAVEANPPEAEAHESESAFTNLAGRRQR
jgi:cytoskeletal protein CcmA (bactofilin family)